MGSHFNKSYNYFLLLFVFTINVWMEDPIKVDMSYSYVQPIFFFLYHLFAITEIYPILALFLPKPEENIYERNLSSI